MTAPGEGPLPLFTAQRAVSTPPRLSSGFKYPREERMTYAPNARKSSRLMM